MPHFFIKDENAHCDGRIKITGNDAFHIARSLRMAVGDTVTVCTPDATEHLCRLDSIRDDECTLSVISSLPSAAEGKAKITLYQGYPKGDKLEFIVQKSVELGAVRIVPFESERCVKRPKADKIEKQTERLRRIAEEAAKQCGRGIIPTVEEPLSFEGMLKDAAENDAVLFCYEGENTNSIKDALSEISIATHTKVGIIIGCEGGFSREEADLCRTAGFFTVHLGARILRCETAALYVTGIVGFFLDQ